VGPTKTFILENDITLTQPWTAIAPFNAVFDGGGHTITITSFGDPVLDGTGVLQGFFAYVNNAEIKDLTIRYDLSVPVNMTTGNPMLAPTVGGIAGRAMSTVFRNIQVQMVNVFSVTGTVTNSISAGGIVGNGIDTTITNCHVSGAIAGNSTGSLDIGGIQGYLTNSSTITGSSFTGTINGLATGASGFCIAGGIAGDLLNGGEISGCYTEGRIEGTGDIVHIGGIVGFLNLGSIMIKKCYVAGVVKGTGTGTGSAHSGGIVGYSGGITIENCYARAYVETQISTGASSVGAGGIVGALGSGATLRACYALGTAKADGVSPTARYAGGIAGELYGSGNTVEYCVALNDTIGLPPTLLPFPSASHRIAGSANPGTTFTSNYAASDIYIASSLYDPDLDGDITLSRSDFADSAANYPSAGWIFDSTNWTFISGYNYPVPFWQEEPPADPASF
jgi:hypothetical protein